MNEAMDSGIKKQRGDQRARKSARVALSADVTLRRTAHGGYRVQVFDASPDGCRVEFVERPELDERVWVKFDGLDSLEALVCWIDGFNAGLEFEHPMHPAVFETLVRRMRRRSRR